VDGSEKMYVQLTKQATSPVLLLLPGDCHREESTSVANILCGEYVSDDVVPVYVKAVQEFIDGRMEVEDREEIRRGRGGRGRGGRGIPAPLQAVEEEKEEEEEEEEEFEETGAARVSEEEEEEEEAEELENEAEEGEEEEEEEEAEELENEAEEEAQEQVTPESVVCAILQCPNAADLRNKLMDRKAKWYGGPTAVLAKLQEAGLECNVHRLRRAASFKPAVVAAHRVVAQYQHLHRVIKDLRSAQIARPASVVIDEASIVAEQVTEEVDQALCATVL
jgi:cobalamin biosynthesis protein CobT